MGASDEYLTPAWLFDLMAVDFDLDVCTPPDGVPWIPAAKVWSKSDNGLIQPWQGRVWMNPPYSNSAPWVRRFIQHRNGIALLQHCRSHWHGQLWASADALADPNAGTPNGNLFQFVKDGRLTNVYMPVVLAAYGTECVDAVRRVGPLRLLEVSA
jgi:DNA N-6-adenine-methyltransferase (Dam)